MKENERLNTRQRRFVAAMLEAKSIRQACEMVDIAEVTGWRYLQDANVKRELSRYTDALLAQAATGLLADLVEARQTLREIMADREAADGARVSAARAVLDASLRLFELVSLSERVSELEQRIEGNDGQN